MSPSRVCERCNSVTQISRRQERHLHEDMDYFCSAKCLKEYIIETPPHYAWVEYTPFTPDPHSVINDPFAFHDSERDMWFRSRYEQLFAKFLDKIGIKWEYERYRFDVKKTIYVPDFFLPDKNVFVEVKGYWLASSRKKMTLFTQQNPDVRMMLVPWILKTSIEHFIKRR